MSQKMETLWAFFTAGSLSLFSILFYPFDELSLFGLILLFVTRTLGIIIFGYLLYYIVGFILKILKVKTTEDINTYVTTACMIVVTIVYIFVREIEKNYSF